MCVDLWLTQTKNALLALYSHLAQQQSESASKQLLEDEGSDIYLVIGLKKVPLKASNVPITM